MATSAKARREQLREHLLSQGLTMRHVASEIAGTFRVRPRTAWRYAMGWPQWKLVQQLRAANPGFPISESRVSEWESWPYGGAKPSLTILGALAHTFGHGCTVGDLLDEADLDSYSTPERHVLNGGALLAAGGSAALVRASPVQGPQDRRTHLAIGPPMAVGPPSGSEVEGDSDVERRGFIGLVAKAAMVGLTGAELDRIRIVPQAAPAPGRIGDADVRNLESTVEFFRAQDDQFGGESVRSAVGGHLQWATRMLDSSTSDDVRDRLRCALADLHSLAGWVSFDTGAHKQANRHFANALVLAKESKEHALAAKVLWQMGRVYLHQKEPESAHKVFQLGQLAAQDANSPRAVSLLCLGTAWAHADIGNAEQTKSLLSRASDELARDTNQATPTWLNFMTAAEIEGVSGMAYTALSAHDASFAELGAHHASRSFKMRDDSDARSRASDLIAVAANNLRAGNVTEGVRIASDVLPRLESVRSSRLMDRLAWVQQGANLHPRNGEARELAEQITTLRAA
ncbi:hypothetical protein GCM10027059_38470 [Myceligenerans halotolerans]